LVPRGRERVKQKAAAIGVGICKWPSPGKKQQARAPLDSLRQLRFKLINLRQYAENQAGGEGALLRSHIDHGEDS